jgi:YidC/Oxa1 family membrane protein insertase
MEKRAILAISLSILVLFGFRYFEEKRMGGRKPPPAARSTVPSGGSGAIQGQPPSGTASAGQPPSPAEAPAPAAGVAETQAAARQVVVDGGLYRAVVDNRGGVLSSWILKKYRTTRGEPFEMVAVTSTDPARPYPGSIVLEDAELNRLANHELYEVEVPGGDLGSQLAPPAEVVFRLRRGDLAIEKRYRFRNENYLVDYTATVEKKGVPLPARLLLGQDLGPQDEHLVNPSAQLNAIAKVATKVVREAPPKAEGEVKRVDGEIRWVGLDLHYFALIAIPSQPWTGIEVQKVVVKTAGLDGKEITRDLLRETVAVPGRAQATVFVGPKDQEVLSAVREGDLSDAIDFGMFSFIVRPLLFGLKVIVRFTHNYGLAIILLTLLLTLLLFPFRLKQMVSMKKMQVVQPKVKEIQERYKKYKKTDPRRAEMNQEIMQVYKEHNVNPLGGCVPLLLQMPLLFAFYQLLASSIELRHAPFIGWIHDLSAKDPYYVLPIIMGITMLISQKMTPMTPGSDPTQAKMMMMMPAVFTLMFLNVSSGLNLYFLCSNIFQIGFQKLAERWMAPASPSDLPLRKKSA